MKQSTGKGRRAWFWVGVILLSISALFWLILIPAILEDPDLGVIIVFIFLTTPPMGIGIYCVRRGRKQPAVGTVRDNEPANLGDTRAVKPLTRALKDDNWIVQTFVKRP